MSLKAGNGLNARWRAAYNFSDNS